jgi:hypothetical protein
MGRNSSGSSGAESMRSGAIAVVTASGDSAAMMSGGGAVNT